ncbi:hypothetical protein Poli38472_007592 [Pythium oligandrum]|uniref:Uncharacterized protein n=1 Tax=Pythium oligandrum TaxID=41045 RepID=A0A8K1FL72_PYTOL|nr:hypothetical protein Poli38472_007592 [Pythium oligandrum]|eukprot:TMW67920.1 hypothetical protein Poli38472_007592 [Pythium oligandrum]
MGSASIDAKVWLITGCSSGFGRELAIAARKRGDLVVATARKVATLDELKALGCQVLTLDVTSDDDTVKGVVAQAHALHGRLDILVNNAGFSILGALEEASSKDAQDLFDTNVFGLLRVTRAVLPYMREKRSGTITNIGSQGGYAAFPVCGMYCATKFAVAGISQSLRQEVASLGIDVTLIEPGMFSTNILTQVRRCEGKIEDYAPIVDQTVSWLDSVNGADVDDPAKGAQAIVEALTKTGRCVGRELPARLPLGTGVFDTIQGVITKGQQELDEWKDFTKAEAFQHDKA